VNDVMTGLNAAVAILAALRAVDLIGSPIKMSETPPSYRRHPPYLGENTDEVLEELLGLDEIAKANLRASHII
jgi:crotonobetainyl-CoA:carnitine CoA-transferase CaiB-like acyl-CoA transferase